MSSIGPKNDEAMRRSDSRPGDDAWLARPSTIRLLWWIFAAVLFMSVAVQLLFPVKGKFGLDGWFPLFVG